ncbi:MAG TPA: VWA domain-containing protein [Thermoanaerobaculia bacterium]
MKWLAAFTLFAAAAASAQQVTESLEVRVLEVEVVVLDRNDKPVRGLRREDFDVRIDGKAAEVTNFFAVERGEAVDEGGGAAPYLAKPERIPSHLIVFFDDLHLRQAGRKRALDALKHYIEKNADGSVVVTIIAWNGMSRSTLRPTAKREELLAQLEQLQRQPARMGRLDSERRHVMQQVDQFIANPPPHDPALVAMGLMRDVLSFAQSQVHEVETTLDALKQIIAISSGLPGRKTLLYVSEALPQQPGAEVLEYAVRVFTRNPVDGFNIEDAPGGRPGDLMQLDLTRAFSNIAKVAQSARVIFSAIDPGGARGAEGTGVEFAAGAERLDAMFIRENVTAGSRAIAEESGGRFIENENDLDRAISVLTDPVSTYYSLGVRPGAGRAELSRVSVRVRGRDDVRVLTPRRRALRSGAEVVASAIRARLYSRNEENPLDARVSIEAPWPEGERCVATATVKVPTTKLTMVPSGETRKGDVSIHAMALDDLGREWNLKSARHSVESAHTAVASFAFTIGFQPRRYVVSFAIVDEASGTTSYLQTEADASICGQ